MRPRLRALGARWLLAVGAALAVLAVQSSWAQYYDDDLDAVDDGVAEPPLFSQQVYSFSVPEHVNGDVTGAADGNGTGWFIGNVSAGFRFDTTRGTAQSNATIVYRALSITYFRVDAASTPSLSVGTVRNSRVLDYDDPAIPNDFEFQVAAATAGDTTTPDSALPQARVRVRVLDLNDNAPRFTQPGGYGATLREDVEVDPPAAVVTVRATDADALFNGLVLYELVGGNATLFAVDAQSGAVTLRSPVDYESATRHACTVMARDRGPEAGQPRQTANVTVTLTLLDANDNAPVLNASSYAVSVPENTAVGTLLLGVSATDADSGDNARVTFSIVVSASGVQAAAVGVDAAGAVTLAQALDFDGGGPTVLRFTVRADDHPTNGDASLRGEASLTVTLVDVNDNRPVWSVDPSTGQTVDYDDTLPEDLAVGTVVATVGATDADEPGSANAALRFSFAVGGNGDGRFAVNASTGAIRLASPLDYENATLHVLLLLVTDLGSPPLAADGPLRVAFAVSDVNDNAPVFDEAATPRSVDIAEDEPPGLRIIATVRATDADAGRNAEVRYVLEDPQVPFSLDNVTGVLRLAAALDFEAVQTYEVVIRAVDRGVVSLSSAGTVNITINVLDVNEFAPQFVGALNYTCTLPEDAAVGTECATVSETGAAQPIVARDLDLSGATVTLQVLGGGGGGVPFALNTTLALGPPRTLAALLTTSGLDFERVESYEFTLRATDSGSPARSNETRVAVVVTDVNDNAPQAGQPVYTRSLPEDAPPGNGTVIANISVTDRDSGDNARFTYSVVDDSGQVPVVQLVPADDHVLVTLASALNYEDTQRYDFTVTIRDRGVPSLSTTVAVQLTVSDVNDNDPILDRSVIYEVFISEDVPVGTQIFQARATDADRDGLAPVTYSFVNTTQTASASFRIHAGTGAVTTLVEFDFETSSSQYELPILATDEGGRRSAIETLIVRLVNANDLNPTFDLEVYRDVRDETNETGVHIVTVRAAERVGGRVIRTGLVYNLTNTSASEAALFRLEQGVDREGFPVATVVTTGQLDFETQVEYNLRITATNTDFTNSPRSGACSVVVVLNDVNDNTPRFSSVPGTVTLREDVGLGTIVGTVAAADADSGAFGTVWYSLVNASALPFELTSPTSGQIVVARPLDFEQTESYRVVVRASDNATASERRYADVAFDVLVEDVNDNRPIYSPVSGAYACSIVELGPSGQLCVRLNASDADGTALFSSVTFSLLGGQGFFGLNGSDVVTTAPLDRRRLDGATLVAVATDGGGLATLGSVTVTVTDTNNHAPQFSQQVYEASVREDASGAEVVRVAATDGDEAATVNSRVAFAIVQGNDDGRFAINSDTGAISTVPASPLDRETVDSYRLTVQATDFGVPAPLASNATLLVTVTDTNDNSPQMETEQLACELPENARTLTVCARVNATDADIGGSGRVEYRILSGNDAGLFAVDPEGGFVYTVGALDRETTPSFTIVLRAFDHGAEDGFTDRASDNVATLTITVSDINDSPPVIEQGLAAVNVSVGEDAAVGTHLLTLTTTDADAGANGVAGHRFALLDADGVFAVNGSGAITTARALDREITASYVFRCEVSDAGNLRDEIVVVVNVSDTNDCTPRWGEQEYVGEISETAQPGTDIVVVNASDCDSPDTPNTELDFEVAQGSLGSVFGFNVTATGQAGGVSSAVLRLLAPSSVIDHETAPTIRFRVRVVDRGSPQRLGSFAFVTVRVRDDNDNRPVYDIPSGSNYTSVVPESARAGSAVAAVFASDADSGDFGRVTYSLVRHGGAPDVFHVSNATGVVQLTALLPAPAPPDGFTLQVVATDGGSPGLATSAWVNVFTAPGGLSFAGSTLSGTVSEDAARGTVATRVTATVAGSGSGGASPPQIRYSLVGGNVGGAFSVDAVTGDVLTASAAGFDVDSGRGLFVLSVLANDAANGGLPNRTAVAVVTVAVEDVNDQSPAFDVPVYTVTVPECLNGTLSAFNSAGGGCLAAQGALGVAPRGIRAVDGDAPNTPLSTVTYSIVGGHPSFAISPATGALSLRGAPPGVDREAASSHVLRVQAADQGVPLRTAEARVEVTVVDLNDHAPVFGAVPAGLRVREDASNGTVVAVLDASDDDLGDNGRVTFSLVRGAGSPPVFAVHPTSGAVTTAGGLDYDSGARHYLLTVRATDAGVFPGPLHTDVVVNVSVTDANDLRPEWSSGTSGVYAVLEGTPAGESVLRVTATDGDTLPENRRLTYSIDRLSSGFPFFSVNGTTGEVVTAGQVLDREQRDAYTLLIDVTDAGTPPLRANESVVVNISVVDRNDATPAFERPRYSADLSEGAAPGDRVVRVAATDGDEPGSLNAALTYSVLDDERFAVDPATGWVTVAAAGAGAFDYENTSARAPVFRVMAADGGVPSLNSTAEVQIFLSDINDNVPILDCSALRGAVTIGEGSVNGTFLARAVEGPYAVAPALLNDDTPGVRDSLTFSVVGGPPGAVAVGAQSGVLVTARQFDFENRLDRVVTVQVAATETGLGAGGQPVTLTSAACNFTLLVADENDNSPQFSLPRYAVSVPENAGPRLLLHVTADDADATANFSAVRLALVNTSNASSLFSFSSAGPANATGFSAGGGVTAPIFMLGSADFETRRQYNLTLAAYDRGGRSATVEVVVTVQDVNDNAPQFERGFYAANVSEAAPRGSVVATVRATDGDMPGTPASRVVYAIVAGDPAGDFAVNGTSGEVVVRSALDREAVANYTLNVSATDSSPPFFRDFAVVAIRLLDENDNSPVFAPSNATASVAENFPAGQLVATLAATDADEGANGEVRFSIVGGNPNPPAFAINATTGAVTTAASLDYESRVPPEFNLTIAATDGGSPPRAASAWLVVRMVDENDNAPVFGELTLSSVVERVTSPGQEVVDRLDATDADGVANGFGVVSYRLVPSPASALFAINSTTGRIVTNASFCNVMGSLVLEVEARDQGNPPLVSPSRASIDVSVSAVNHHDPVFAQSGGYRAVLRETAAQGALIAALSATDLDCGDTERIVYTLVGGNPDPPFFAVNSTTGAVTLLAPVTRLENGVNVTHTLNPVASSAYFLTVSANDRGSPTNRTGTTVVEVNVVDENNHAPAFGQPAGYAATVPESPTPGVAVVTITAQDSDQGANGQIRYSIAGGNTGGAFAIDAVTGAVTTAAATCADAQASYTFAVSASDRGVPPQSTLTTVNVTVLDVNRARPVFASNVSSVAVLETASFPRALLTVSATDADCRDTEKITFRIVGGGAGSLPFSINASTGVISLVAALDYESARSYAFTVEALDNFVPSPGTSTALVVVNVTDVIDEAPRFTRRVFAATLDEGVFINEPLTTLSASDADAGDTLTFSLAGAGSGGAQSIFTVDGASGNVSVTGTLCAAVQSTHEANVTVTDASGANDTATLVLSVRRVNAHAPQFRAVSYANNNAAVDEGNAVGVAVAVVAADDDDCADGPNLRYSVTGGDTALLGVNSTSGVMSALRTFDREQSSQARVVVRVTDNGSPPRTDTVEVTVSVRDLNDVAPAFARRVYNVSVDEGSPAGREVVRVVASDGDATSPNNAVASYAITAGNDDGVLAVDASTGAITLARSPCADANPSFNLSVTATDGGSPPLSGASTVLVTVARVNLFDPQFPAAVFRRTVSEAASVGSVLLQLNATDDDCGGAGGGLVFSLGSSTGPSGALRLDVSNRVLLNQTLDAELFTSFVVQVDVHDRPSAPFRNTSAQVVVTVSDSNDNAPVFETAGVGVAVAEGTPAGVLLARVRAVDADVTAPNNAVSYAVVGGSGAGLFSLSSATGELRTLARLDFESGTTTYTLVVAARDGGQPSLNATCVVRVNVTDINDNSPQFNASSYAGSVPEGTGSGVAVAWVGVSDADSGANGAVRLSLQDPSGLFAISAGGVVSTSVAPASPGFVFDLVREHTVTVLASDVGEPGQPSRQTTARLTVAVTDVNNLPPRGSPRPRTAGRPRKTSTAPRCCALPPPTRTRSPSAPLRTSS